MAEVKIVNCWLLGGFFVVRGPHNTPISGRFDTRAEAQSWIAIASNRKPVRLSTR